MRNIKDFQARYDRWKNGERYWDIRGVDLPRYDTGDKTTFWPIKEPAPLAEVQIPYNLDNQLYGAINTPYVGVEPVITAENKFGIVPTDDPDIWRTTAGDLVTVDRGNSKDSYGFVNPYNGKYMVTDAMQNENDRARKRYEPTKRDIQIAQAMGLDPTLPFADIANGLYKKSFNDAVNSLAWLSGPIGTAARTYVGGRNFASDEGVKKTIDFLQDGRYGRAALSGLGDLFDAALAYPLINKSVGIGKQILIPSNRAAHAYYAISPVGYGNMSQKSRAWIKSMLTGKYPDIENPQWLNNSDLTELEEYIHPIVQNPTALVTQARVDAWRIYNQLPQKYNTFIKRADGSYYYNLNKIKKLTNNTMVPYRPGGEMIDYLGGAGGHVNINPVYRKSFEFDPVNKTLITNGIDIMSDVWDLHPFNRNENTFAHRIINAYASNIVPKILNIRQFLFDKNVVGMNARYPFSRYVSRLENRTLNRLRYTIPFNKFIYNISDKLKNFEVGTISGGKPFLVRTVIPYNITNVLSHLNGFGITKIIDGGLGFSNKYFHPIKIKDLNKFNEEYIPQANIIANDKIKKP